jgi:hypothetical protein
MSSIASAYFGLGRLNDAHAMKTAVLEFWQRVLPQDHPHIGHAWQLFARESFRMR